MQLIGPRPLGLSRVACAPTAEGTLREFLWNSRHPDHGQLGLPHLHTETPDQPQRGRLVVEASSPAEDPFHIPWRRYPRTHSIHSGARGEFRDLCQRGARPQFLTLRVSPPAHPETTPRRVALIRGAQEHAMEQRGGGSRYLRKEQEEGGGNQREEEEKEEKQQEGEDDEEVAGGGEGGGGGGRRGKGEGRNKETTTTKTKATTTATTTGVNRQAFLRLFRSGSLSGALRELWKGV